MLDHFVSPRNQIWLQNSALNSFSETYINALIHDGYAEQSIRTYAHSTAHFAYWLKKQKIPLSRINEKLIDRFMFAHLPACHCSRRCRRSLFNMRAALRHLLKVLRAKGALPPPASAAPGSMAAELAHYEAYLKEVCGLTQNTQIHRLHYVKAFLFYQFGQRAIVMKNVTPKSILHFVVKSSEGFAPATAQTIACALRSYLRFRTFVGDHTQTLMAAVPSVAQWRLATVPKALPPADIAGILNAFDRTTPIGRRDYAMARCLIDLGLRASEVAHLHIDDVNWDTGTLQIKGAKGQRVQLLPLPSQTGKAMVDYLRYGRPATQSRALFVRHRAGIHCPVNTGTVCNRIRLASVRCHIQPSVGTHVLRHSTACRMLQGGANLKGIADVLRHRRLDTTMIYAKVDLIQLAQVAAPWPGRSS